MSTSLSTLKSQEYEIMQGIVESIWDEKTGENLSLTELQNQIQVKTEAFISVTRKGGLFDQLVTETEEKMEDAKKALKALESKRDYIKAIVYDIAIKSPLGYLSFNDGITEQYVKPNMGERRSIKEDVPIQERYKSYSIPKLNNNEFKELSTIINYFIRIPDYDCSASAFTSLAFKCMEEVKTSCNVTDLPEDHPAINTKLTPNFKIVKTKPKG